MPTPPEPLESDIKHAIRQYLTFTGWAVVPIHQGAPGVGVTHMKGISDLIIVKKGRVVWLEVKRPSGKQTEHQKMFEEYITSHGGEYRIARSVEDVVEIEKEGYSGAATVDSTGAQD